MIEKKGTYFNLKNIPVYTEDTSNEYFKIYDLPKSIGQGKHSFLLDITPDKFVV